ALVTGHPSVAALAPIVAGWRNRNRLCDAFLALVRSGSRQTSGTLVSSTTSEAAAWTALERAGGHPDVESYRGILQPIAERLTALARLRDLVRGGEVSDLAVAAAWENLLRTGGEALASPTDRQRAELSLARKPLILALRQIPAGIGPDERDRTLLKIWKS